MSPTTLSQIFTRFSQGDESITKTYQGTGLGMAITQELTRLMEGKIDIQSTLDEGTETTITLPLPLPVTHMAKPLQRSLDDARERLNQTRILVVDDNDINLMIFASQLESAGVSVDTANSVPEAIDLLDNAYDLILTDICMPKLSGVDFINHINQQKIDCPVVAITGSISEQKMQEYDDVGFKDVLSKPIGNDQFLIRLAKVLS
ncbi:MAG: Autoinducer 2 sensor kinase/phosphatase LuxQ [Glaciecola sp. HTCC2999]|nr:MAG: Autoinducer 2 sensor kinase/phosphatase LuxQ [Glaciecola sp. HTCC2999]